MCIRDSTGTVHGFRRPGWVPMKSLLSIVVPCFNEAEVLWETHGRLVRTLTQLADLDAEILYVDDGSRDETPEVMRALQTLDTRVRTLRFSRNFGHQTAVTAGLEHASGDAVVLIDADLQDPPEVIADMVERWHEGYDVAYGVRKDREGETRFKLATAKAFYRLLNRMSETRIPLDTGDFRLMDRRVVDTLLIERVLDLAVLVTLFFVGLLAIPRGVIPSAFIT